MKHEEKVCLVLAYLEDRKEEGFTSNEVAEATGVSGVKKILRRLVKDGTIVRIDDKLPGGEPVSYYAFKSELTDRAMEGVIKIDRVIRTKNGVLKMEYMTDDEWFEHIKYGHCHINEGLNSYKGVRALDEVKYW